MKIVHLVLSESFAGIEQHVDEILSTLDSHDAFLICNKSIANFFNQKISVKYWVYLILFITKQRGSNIRI